MQASDGYAGMFNGTVQANYHLDAVTLTVVDSDGNTVLDQPFRVNAEVNKAEKIVLTISSGTAPTETPTVPKATEPEPKTINVTFMLPAERTEAYVLSILQNGREVVEAQEIQPGTGSVTVKLTGTGKQTYDLYINNEFYNSQEVNFGG